MSQNRKPVRCKNPRRVWTTYTVCGHRLPIDAECLETTACTHCFEDRLVELVTKHEPMVIASSATHDFWTLRTAPLDDFGVARKRLRESLYKPGGSGVIGVLHDDQLRQYFRFILGWPRDKDLEAMLARFSQTKHRRTAWTYPVLDLQRMDPAGFRDALRELLPWHGERVTEIASALFSYTAKKDDWAASKLFSAFGFFRGDRTACGAKHPSNLSSPSPTPMHASESVLALGDERQAPHGSGMLDVTRESGTRCSDMERLIYGTEAEQPASAAAEGNLQAQLSEFLRGAMTAGEGKRATKKPSGPERDRGPKARSRNEATCHDSCPGCKQRRVRAL